MTRILAVLFSLLVIGTAVAQPPVDYTLLCDGEIIGTASYVGGELHVAVVAGATCDGVLSVAEDDTLDLTLEWGDGVLAVTIDDMSGEPVSGPAIEVPQQAIDGMVGAARNRTAAAERRGHGQENSAAKREQHQPERPIRPIVPEPPIQPIAPDLPVVPVEPETSGRPELPVAPAQPDAPRGRRP